MAIVAVAVGFVSCDDHELSDDKYQNKLVGEWSLKTMDYEVKTNSVSQIASYSLPSVEMELDEVIFDIRANGSLLVTSTYGADSEMATYQYQVRDGNLYILMPEGDVLEPGSSLYFDIEDVTRRKLVLEMEMKSTEDGVTMEVNVRLTFDKR